MAVTKRILMVAERFAPDIGGVARSASRIADSMAAAGADVHVLSWTKALPPGVLNTSAQNNPCAGLTPAGEINPSKNPSDEVRTTITVHRLGLFANVDFSLQHTMNVMEWLQAAHRFDAVWGHYLYPSGFMAVWFAEWAGIPSIVSARGNDVDRMLFPPGDFARLQWTLQRAAVVNAVSRDLARKIDQLLGRPGHTAVLHNVVDSTVFTPGPPDRQLRTALNISDDDVILGFCGELRQKKGLPFLLNAFQELLTERPAILLVIGELRIKDQDQLNVFRSESPAAAARIRFTGQLSVRHDQEQTDERHEVARHLRLCDLVLQPSLWDGLPNSVLEAMACGRIVLGSDAGGIPEVIEHGRSGFIVARAELHRLGTGIRELLRLTPPQRSAIETAARERVCTSFNRHTEVKAMEDLLTSLPGDTRVNTT